MVRFSRKKSTKTNAAIASTIGTALGTTHGSCLPFPFISTILLLERTANKKSING